MRRIIVTLLLVTALVVPAEVAIEGMEQAHAAAAQPGPDCAAGAAFWGMGFAASLYWLPPTIPAKLIVWGLLGWEGVKHAKKCEDELNSLFPSLMKCKNYYWASTYEPLNFWFGTIYKETRWYATYIGNQLVGVACGVPNPLPLILSVPGSDGMQPA